jgi:hypothetical protein
MSEPLTLPERLRLSAQLWTERTGFTLARLGRDVVNDGGFFARIESGAAPTTTTLEKFASYLGDAGNWPEGIVPDEVAAFVHVTGVTPERVAASAGKAGDISPAVAA